MVDRRQLRQRCSKATGSWELVGSQLFVASFFGNLPFRCETPSHCADPSPERVREDVHRVGLAGR